MPTHPRKSLLLLAFATVYVVWGSTYLAIKYALISLPPLLMAGGRFVVAGSIMLLVARRTAGYQAPTSRQ